MEPVMSLALAAHGPPSILEPLFKTVTTSTTTTTTTTAAPTSSSSSSPTLSPTTGSTLLTAILENLTSTAASGLYDPYGNQTNSTLGFETKGPRYSLASMVVMGFVAAILSTLTVAGNVMVMISFKIDKQLQTISNYFLFSLAIADFAIGAISMPLFAVTTILGYWPLGPHVCDTWLALDYLASNASVLNLLIISFDRYFSVTRPLTYRAKRTTNKAAVMIGAAWGISLLLWPPWIYSWPYIEGKRTVPKDECYIQFIETNHYITFGTAIAAFYFPVTIMCFLYFRIWRETKKRQKDLPNLQAGKKDSSKRSNSSDENTVVNHTAGGLLAFAQLGGNDHDTWRRPRSESSADAESVYMTNMVIDSGYHGMHSRKSSIKSTNTIKKSYSCLGSVKEWCIAWWHSGREDSDDFAYEPEEPSDLGYATPVTIETPLQSSVSRCTSMNVMRDNYSMGGSVSGVRPPSIMLADVSPTPMRPPLNSISQMQEMNAVGNGSGVGGGGGGNGNGNVNANANGIGNVHSNLNSNVNGNVNINISINGSNNVNPAVGGNSSNINMNNGGATAVGCNNPNLSSLRDSRTLPVDNRIASRSVSQDSVYTILIRLPPDGTSGSHSSNTAQGGGGVGNVASHADCAPSIKMIHEDVSSVGVAGSGVGGVGGGGMVTTAPPPTRRPLPSRDSEFSLPLGRRMSHAPQDVRLLNAKVIPKQLGKAGAQHALLNARNAAKKKKKSQEKRQESKAAKTLSAILLSFIITWTPYNILVLIKPLTTCSDCIPTELWDFFYALCYINSTINPMCYALCNASFRRTYIRILTCKWHTRNREGMVRGVYN
ncbi:muscarinic acetylcholine receptor DM1 isoform X1 [Drosophila albomicans]|uniref:Muscarinic acetylcholine receptor DM1 isoform X1 n=1 Tax=Drosophila albomicans TaxID=7291 RepID=A0A6P8X6Q3_DROAB|nr:muscarinic acetylcholine receptor DM1 isoform X1 [Drosophila albomicans]XP_034108664.1 muscarinic acetylcholine receptor DM1 isoform X1 [Drosophila albomicans]XP_051860519.1 muscarinic acetylcholine receptor DM1 isoform X1 [Drosophila albomicans]XP_051860520.1 muscarinic acetylcholine receptor DM1 isoform X1 [Drosophila albomicans]